MHKIFTISHQRILQYLNTTKIEKNTIGELLRSKKIAAYPGYIFHKLPRQDLRDFVKIICPVTNPIEEANIVQVSKKMRNSFSIDEAVHCFRCPMKDTCPKKGIKSQESTDAAADILLFYQAMNDIQNKQVATYRTWTSGYKIVDNVIAMMDDLSRGAKQTMQFQQLRKQHILAIKQLKPNPTNNVNSSKVSNKNVEKQKKDGQLQQEDKIKESKTIDSPPQKRNDRGKFRENSDQFSDVPRNNNRSQQYNQNNNRSQQYNQNINRSQQYNQQRPKWEKRQYPRNQQRYPKQQYQRNDRFNRSQPTENFRKQFRTNENNFNNRDNSMNRFNQNSFNNRDRFNSRNNNNSFETRDKFSNRNVNDNYDRNNDRNFENKDRFTNKSNYKNTTQERSNPQMENYNKSYQPVNKKTESNPHIKKWSDDNEDIQFQQFQKESFKIEGIGKKTQAQFQNIHTPNQKINEETSNQTAIKGGRRIARK